MGRTKRKKYCGNYFLSETFFGRNGIYWGLLLFAVTLFFSKLPVVDTQLTGGIVTAITSITGLNRFNPAIPNKFHHLKSKSELDSNGHRPHKLYYYEVGNLYYTEQYNLY